MNPKATTGLGEPLPTGKRSLFQPPEASTESGSSEKDTKKNQKHPKKKVLEKQVNRVRTTIELTPKALTVIQDVQQRHRLKTGKVLPLWKAVSQAIEAYAR